MNSGCGMFLAFVIALGALIVALSAIASARNAERKLSELRAMLNSLERRLADLQRRRADEERTLEKPASAATEDRVPTLEKLVSAPEDQVPTLEKPVASAPQPAAAPQQPEPLPPTIEAPFPAAAAAAAAMEMASVEETTAPSTAPPVSGTSTVTPPPPIRPPLPPTPAGPSKAFDWEGLVGVKLFSWIAGIALVLAAIFFLRYSVQQGWLSPVVRAAIGLIAGSTLIAVCELRVARGFAMTANAMHGAGIAILYATLFATHALWHILSPAIVFPLMIVVTAVAVMLSIRRDSVFIALLGLVGGFATPALLSSGENRPVALFGYLLMLNVGLAFVGYRKRWPALTGFSLIFTVLYEWGWIAKFLTPSQMPLAAAIFVVFAAVSATALWAAAATGSRTNSTDSRPSRPRCRYFLPCSVPPSPNTAHTRICSSASFSSLPEDWPRSRSRAARGGYTSSAALPS